MSTPLYKHLLPKERDRYKLRPLQNNTWLVQDGPVEAKKTAWLTSKSPVLCAWRFFPASWSAFPQTGSLPCRGDRSSVWTWWGQQDISWILSGRGEAAPSQKDTLRAAGGAAVAEAAARRGGGRWSWAQALNLTEGTGAWVQMSAGLGEELAWPVANCASVFSQPGQPEALRAVWALGRRLLRSSGVGKLPWWGFLPYPHDAITSQRWLTASCEHRAEWHRPRHPPTAESKVAPACPTLCDPIDCSLPGFSVHGIFQARILEWVAISFSRRSSQPRDWTTSLAL